MPKRGGAAQVTTDHDFIRHWVEERGGTPATVKRTSRPGAPGIIRIDFPGYSGAQSLSPISWDEFFKKFDQSHLAFLYQEDLARGGGKSRFSKLVKRETVEARAHERPASMSSARQPEMGTRGGSSATRTSSGARSASSASRGTASRSATRGPRSR